MEIYCTIPIPVDTPIHTVNYFENINEYAVITIHDSIVDNTSQFELLTEILDSTINKKGLFNYSNSMGFLKLST